MKKILLVVVVQGLDIFVISVCFVYFCGGIFFRALAPIFGLAAGGFRFLTAMVTKAFAPSLYEDSKKKE